MTVGRSDHEMFLKDGAAAIPMLYSMKAGTVDPY